MLSQEIEALVGGYHGDPFRLLGPHQEEDGAGQSAWVVRAFLPQAQEAVLVTGTSGTPMKRETESGLFTAALAEQPATYRLRLKRHDGATEEIDDPYRFPALLSGFDLHLHAEGTNYEAYHMLGAHLTTVEGVAGVRFAVWAPHAHTVSVVGAFNEWDTRRHPMRLREGGVWELFVPGVQHGAPYKYNVRSKFRGYEQQKADPYAFGAENPPLSASVVTDLNRHEWQDSAWMERRAHTDWLKQPMSIYEVHLGSWMHKPGGQYLTYRELADKLVAYVKQLGYTHIELLPIQEHPYSGSWGYQVTGYFAPTARYGTPEDFMYFVDRCHQASIGVIVDWVPAHFPKDAHGLAFFDGTALYEHEDPRLGEHRDWGTLIFNFGRNEVVSFLISSALFWLKRYHIDGLRVDAVASMLYLDYSRKQGEWVPNRYGGNENLEAIALLRTFNTEVHKVPGAVTIAEESTSFPGVSKPVYLNGLGFTMKWNMGWMHDTLEYFAQDPVYRKFHHSKITFSLVYAFSENFVLPISHDEVVHLKGSLLRKMPGDEWQRFANCRAFLAYMWAHPGKKLLFMGAEIGVYEEWNHNSQLRWQNLDFPYHRKLQYFQEQLNALYQREPALYEVDYNWSGFEWLDLHDVEYSTLAFLRRAQNPQDFLLFCCNFTPVPRLNYRVGVPEPGAYAEALNSDSEYFGGSNLGNGGLVHTSEVPSHGRPHSLCLTLPPLSVIALKPQR